MFERFTNDARQVVHRAHKECGALGHSSIGTAHLLLALSDGDGDGARALRDHGLEPDDLRERVRRLAGPRADPIDGAALAAIGIDLDEVRRTVEAAFGAGALEGGRRRGRMTFTPQAKKSLELSLRSALALKHRHINSGHVLLGVLRSRDAHNLALDVLADAEVDAGDLAATATRIVQSNAA